MFFFLEMLKIFSGIQWWQPEAAPRPLGRRRPGLPRQAGSVVVVGGGIPYFFGPKFHYLVIQISFGYYKSNFKVLNRKQKVRKKEESES